MSKQHAKPAFDDLDLDQLDEVVGGCHGGFGNFQFQNQFQNFGNQGFNFGNGSGIQQQLQSLLSSSPNGGSYEFHFDSVNGSGGTFTDANGNVTTLGANGLTSAGGGAQFSGGGGGSGV